MRDRSRELLDLLDWKLHVFELYAAVRSSSNPRAAWRHWREGRDKLFREHLQSPLPMDQRQSFHGLPYFEYDPGTRVLAEVRPTESETLRMGTSHPDSIDFTRFGIASFELDERLLSLELYWLEGYGGGLFLPFSDTTRGDETYGGGRYMLDTVKGADRPGGRTARPGLQLRVQPVLRLRPTMGMPTCTSAESTPGPRPCRGAARIGRGSTRSVDCELVGKTSYRAFEVVADHIGDIDSPRMRRHPARVCDDRLPAGVGIPRLHLRFPRPGT